MRLVILCDLAKRRQMSTMYRGNHFVIRSSDRGAEPLAGPEGTGNVHLGLHDRGRKGERKIYLIERDYRFPVEQKDGTEGSHYFVCSTDALFF